MSNRIRTPHLLAAANPRNFIVLLTRSMLSKNGHDPIGARSPRTGKTITEQHSCAERSPPIDAGWRESSVRFTISFASPRIDYPAIPIALILVIRSSRASCFVADRFNRDNPVTPCDMKWLARSSACSLVRARHRSNLTGGIIRVHGGVSCFKLRAVARPVG